MDVTDILDPLNEAQRQAVTSEADALLVLAGAGSGKTRVLVHRIGWLVQVEQLSPFSILAVTFTNKAAGEMRQRIEQLLQAPAGGMWVGTFHNIAHRLLRAHWQEARLPQNFEILDSEDQLRLIKRLMKALEIDESRWPPRQAQWFINGRKDEGLRAGHIDPGHDPFLKTQCRLYQAYEEACNAGGMVDFNELLLRAHELLRDNPALLQHYQHRFRHILVDEFQDTNAVQYAWLRLLSAPGNRITIVGDDDQSIYGWRGACIENIRRFDQDFPGAETIRLEQNYRSTATILNAANAVISNNTGRLGKELWTEGNEGSPIYLYEAFNELDEASFIAEQAENWANKGYRNADMAVLYRSNAQSRILEEAFIRNGIPYRIYGGQRFFERLEIKNALAYLRLLENRHADAAFERVINTPTRGIGQKTLEAIRLHARSHQQPMWEAARQMTSERKLSPKACAAVSCFLDLIDRLADHRDALPLSELTELTLEETGLLAFHKNEKGEKGQQRVENLQELVAATREFDPDDADEHTSTLTAFLDHAALESGEGQADQYEDAIQMMTLHSAKGLEFPIVFIAGMEQGLFPHQMSLDEADGIEEERRLCYVGITRAMEQLYLTYAECRRQWGSENYNAPSQFIREIPAQLLQEVRIRGSVKRPANTHLKQQDTGQGDGSYQLGERVTHPKFGDGTVINCEGSGPNARLQINFDSVGSKWLIAQYAKLAKA